MEEMTGKTKHIRCGKCDFSTARAIELARHIKAIHVKIRSDSKCPDCEFKAPTMSALLLHIKSTHRKQGFEEGNITAERVKKHENVVDEPKVSYADMICEALKPAKNRMLLHSEICSFISQKYTHYKMEDQSWQDDIRQTLRQKFKKVSKQHLNSAPINGDFTSTDSKPSELAVRADFNVQNPNVRDLSLEHGDGNDFNDIVEEELNESGEFHIPMEDGLDGPQPTFEDTDYERTSNPDEESKDFHPLGSLGFKCNLCDHVTRKRVHMAIHVKAVHHKIKDYICGNSTSRTNYPAIHMKNAHGENITFKRGPPLHTTGRQEEDKQYQEQGQMREEFQGQVSEGVPVDNLGEDIIEPGKVIVITNAEAADSDPKEANGTKNIVLECPHCEMKLSTGAALASHIRNWHGVKCPQCGLQLISSLALENHWRFCVGGQESGKIVVAKGKSDNENVTERRAIKQINILKRNFNHGAGNIQSRTCIKCNLVTGSATELYQHFISVHSNEGGGRRILHNITHLAKGKYVNGKYVV